MALRRLHEQVQVFAHLVDTRVSGIVSHIPVRAKSLYSEMDCSNLPLFPRHRHRTRNNNFSACDQLQHILRDSMPVNLSGRKPCRSNLLPTLHSVPRPFIRSRTMSSLHTHN